MKRVFDIFLAFIGLVILSPLFIIIALLIVIDSGNPVFYLSERLGRKEKVFTIIKFRTMQKKSDHSAITIGSKDPRITNIGYYLRKLKMDELPQLINVFIGNMSIVGPRPDVPKYKKYYKKYFADYYKMKPGITCYSSLYFKNESDLYVGRDNPEQIYIEETIPQKVALDYQYYRKMNIFTDLNIIIKTIISFFKDDA
jgi:lipopolysaccharide/colanic/teichoic acid biosynthesis glycosyltransferase